jgi:hypothetical protein
MAYGPQRQCHGPTKNIFEGVVGAVLVLLRGDLLAKRPNHKPPPKTEAGTTSPGEKESEA